jgi:hypothetical protein
MRSFAASSCLLLLLLQPAAAQVKLDEDLCNYPVEGLTLRSTKAEIDAVFRPRGWQDNSTKGLFANTDLPAETWIYERIPRDGSIEQKRGRKAGDSRFVMPIGNGIPRSIEIGKNYEGENDSVALEGRPGLLKTAEAACRLSDPRFVLRGCERIKPGSNLVSISIEPARLPTTPYCRVQISGREGKGFGVTVYLMNPPDVKKPTVR